MRPTLYELAVVALFAATLAIVVGKPREPRAHAVPTPVAEELRAAATECAYDRHSDCEHTHLDDASSRERVN